MQKFKAHDRVIYLDGSHSRPMYLMKRFEAEVVSQNELRTKTRIRYSRNGRHFMRSWVKTERLIPIFDDGLCAICARPRVEHHEFMK